MAAIAGPDPRDPDSRFADRPDYLAFARGDLRGKKVALSPDFGRGRTLEPDLVACLEEAAAILRSLGCVVVEADPPILTEGDELEPGVWAYSGDHYGAAENLVPGFWEKHKDDLTEYAYPIYEAGQRALAWQYRRVLRRNRAFHEEMKRWFEGYDYILSPVANGAPPLEIALARDDRRGIFGFLAPFNHAYNPAASVPMGFDPAGMPLGVQIVGKLGDDLGVLRASALLEAARPWAQDWPSFALSGMPERKSA
jgi:aspartyl-tRNA(Asn)/glutamyl-tRNA(Gln) amidotransferase subunit A